MSSSPHPPSSKMHSRGKGSEKHDSNGPLAGVWRLLLFPVRILQPRLSRLAPLLVCLLCIPLLMISSGAAGWSVWRNVPVGWKAEAFLQYGEAPVPYAHVVLPTILADQPYDISLHLVVPATGSNYALGNFMTTLKLTTAYNDSIVTARRPAALVPPRSSFAKQLLVGAPSTTKIEVLLLSQFVSGTSSVHARLELGRSDGWRTIGSGEGRELSVIEATLKGRVRPRGFLALLARYPFLATFASTFTFFFVSLSVFSCILFIAVRSGPPSRSSSQKSSSGSDYEEEGDDPSGKKMYIRPKRDRTSGSRAPDDDKLPPQSSGNGASMSSLRNRRSTPPIEPVSTVRIKLEDMPVRRGTTPPPYPKSPYPRSASASSDSSSRQRNKIVDPAPPWDADEESS